MPPGKPRAALALFTLGGCFYRLAERATTDTHVAAARRAFEAGLRLTGRRKDPVLWGSHLHGLGTVLQGLGERARDAGSLRQAVAAARAALAVAREHDPDDVKNASNTLGTTLQTLAEVTADPAPLPEAIACLEDALALKDRTADLVGWAETRNNLGLARRWRGALTGDLSDLDRAREDYAACEGAGLRDAAPFLWARLQWNIADLALARFRLAPDPALLDAARSHLAAARAVFAEGSDHQTARCDALLAEVEAAAQDRRAGG